MLHSWAWAAQHRTSWRDMIHQLLGRTQHTAFWQHVDNLNVGLTRGRPSSACRLEGSRPKFPALPKSPDKMVRCSEVGITYSSCLPGTFDPLRSAPSCCHTCVQTRIPSSSHQPSNRNSPCKGRCLRYLSCDLPAQTHSWAWPRRTPCRMKVHNRHAKGTPEPHRPLSGVCARGTRPTSPHPPPAPAGCGAGRRPCAGWSWRGCRRSCAAACGCCPAGCCCCRHCCCQLCPPGSRVSLVSLVSLVRYRGAWAAGSQGLCGARDSLVSAFVAVLHFQPSVWQLPCSSLSPA